jgi:hypothetical protein
VKRGIVFIFATVFLDMLGLGIIAPVLPKLLLTLTGDNGARAVAIFGLFRTSLRVDAICLFTAARVSVRSLWPPGRDRPLQSRPGARKLSLMPV